MASIILLITDDATVDRQVELACERLEARLVRPGEARSDVADDGERDAHAPPDLIICDDRRFGDVQQAAPGVCTLVIGSAADSDRAIDAIKHGAIDYLIRPLNVDYIERAIRDALRIAGDIDLPGPRDDEHEPDRDTQRIVGQSPAMKDVYKRIGLIAPRNINVLITGESGTGKELVARAIVEHSPRRDQPFVAVNCAAIPETLLESELFGHEKGAFTGADQRRIGRFEQCHGGTLFLDEIGDIPLATQVKLLRVLQDRTIQRLGGSQTITCDVRIIAATHQPLAELIAERRFRQDLYYRLNVATIHVPPLREREVDAVLLAHHFVERYNRDFGTQIQSFAPETLPILLRYPWPGNVRELENAIKAALVLARGPVLRPEFLPAAIREYRGDRTGADAAAPTTDSPAGGGFAPTPDAAPDGALRTYVEGLLRGATPDGAVHGEALAALERELIRAALTRTRGQLAPAAKRLGISRTTLRRKVADLGIVITVS